MTLADYIDNIKSRTELVTRGELPVAVKGDRMLEVLGAPYGGNYEGKDADGEFFSPRTDFMLDIGDRRPALYLHGRTPRGSAAINPELIGKAIMARRDDDGVWFDVMLSDNSLANRVWEAAQAGTAKASSGAVNYLVRKEASGEILTWPLAELSVFDTGQGRQPANQLARVELKTLFKSAEIELPESFLESGELKKELAQEDDRVLKIIQLIK